MGVPHSAGSFGDLVDKRVTKIFYDQYKQLPSKKGDLFSIMKSSDQYEIWSEVGALPEFEQFTGQVGYKDQSQGYDVQATHLQFASGIQIERELYDDDRHHIWQRRPAALANAAYVTQETHAARLFNMAFSNDTMFYTNSENVALCSDSHTTTTGVSTATGFDNRLTSPLSATALAAARIQMVQFRDDQANRIAIMPDTIWVPNNLYDVAYEVTESMGKPATGDNDANVHYGKYQVKEWNYMSDTNDWFLCDMKLAKDWVIWWDRVPLEFAFAEEMDNIVAKWRAYMRYSLAYYNWRWILGFQVA